MAIQKKSLITNLSATKKAVVASNTAAPASSNSSVLGPVQSFKGSKALRGTMSMRGTKALKGAMSMKGTKALRAQASMKSMRSAGNR